MKEDTGQILIVDKIVNNNIVIAKDFRGREVVAIGKGVGFRKRKNEAVHRSEIMKTYVLLDKVDSGVLTLFEEIQFEVIETSQKIIDYAQEKLNVKFNVNLLMSLSEADYKTNLNYKSSGWFFLCNLYKNGKTRKRCKRMNDSAFLNSRRTGIFKDMSNGTICIPKDLRDNNGLEKNDRVELIPMQEGIYIRKAYGEKKCQ